MTFQAATCTATTNGWDDVNGDPTVRAAMEQAWIDSNPGDSVEGGEGRRGAPPPDRREQGGWVIRHSDGGYSIERWEDPGSTFNGITPTYPPPSGTVGGFHTHPHGRGYFWEQDENGYWTWRKGAEGPSAEPGDVSVAKYSGVPQYVLTHGRIYRVNADGSCDDLMSRDAYRADPTFIQAPPGLTKRRTPIQDRGLIAWINVPVEGSLLRGNVPIFGDAGGENFAAYSVEFGAGPNPQSWTTLTEATDAQAHLQPNLGVGSGDTTLRGNLGTWDTGLGEYVYMPDYPPDHPVNLAGVYTLRLVVTGKDGAQIEDRRTVEVGGVIPNAWGARITSDDGFASLDIPEHAIFDTFRLVSILAAGRDWRPAPANLRFTRAPFVFREPGEPFTTEVRFSVQAPEDVSINPLSRALYRFDPASALWGALPTVWNEREQTYSTWFRSLPEAGSAIALLDGGSAASMPEPPSGPRIRSAVAGDMLVDNTFEGTPGDWRPRGERAAVVVDAGPARDGSHSLRVVNQQGDGNFGVTAFAGTFDVREYPIISFDYRIGPGAKADLYAKVAGRWYNVGFADDPQAFQYKRVNIADIGRVPDAKADNRWHRAKLNLADMLATRTGHHIVEELIFADWDVEGYMRLAFGDPPAGATYYIDNFSIARGPVRPFPTPTDAEVLVDDFSLRHAENALGRAERTFTSGGARIDAVRESITGRNAHGALRLSFGGPIGELFTYAGWATDLGGMDLRGHDSIDLRVRGASGSELMNLYLDDGVTRAYVDLEDYADVSTSWIDVSIPLARFVEQGVDASHVESIQAVFEWTPMEGTVFIDDIKLLPRQ